jgi:uncharacterized protein YkwD
MKTQPVTRFLAVVCAGALASCASPPPPTPTKLPVSATNRPDTSLAGRLFQEVNAYRRSQGAGELQRHAGLDRLAQDHCEYLRKHRGTFKLHGKNVSHIGFEGRTLIAREHFRMENISENVAAANHPGSNPTTVILNLWKNSRDHHKNMTDGWTHSGIGVVVDSDGMTFATQLFSTVSMSQMSNRERFTRF